jgi:hypothetical protein
MGIPYSASPRLSGAGEIFFRILKTGVAKITKSRASQGKKKIGVYSKIAENANKKMG